MTLLVELRKELRKTEQLRKEFENKVALLKQKETRLHQLDREISGSISSQTTGRPMSQEHRRKISESLKRRHAQSKP
jgi:hypothetical protein